jgi:hypothetical protein
MKMLDDAELADGVEGSILHRQRVEDVHLVDLQARVMQWHYIVHAELSVDRVAEVIDKDGVIPQRRQAGREHSDAAAHIADSAGWADAVGDEFEVETDPSNVAELVVYEARRIGPSESLKHRPESGRAHPAPEAIRHAAVS